MCFSIGDGERRRCARVDGRANRAVSFKSSIASAEAGISTTTRTTGTGGHVSATTMFHRTRFNLRALLSITGPTLMALADVL